MIPHPNDPESPRKFGPVAWLRIGVRVLAMLVCLVTCVLGAGVWRLLGLQDPWPRRFLVGVSAIMGVHRRASGTPANSRTVFLANHLSWLDIAVLAAETGTIFVGHDGLGSEPVIRWLCALHNTVLVARHDRGSVALQVEQLREAISKHPYVTLFPEGTTSDGKALLPFKSSLLSALEPLPPGVTVQPVLLDYGGEVDDIAWVGSEHGLDNFLRMAARTLPVGVTIHFLNPLSGPALASRKAMASAAQAVLERRLREITV